MATKIAKLARIPNTFAICRNFSHGKVIFNRPEATTSTQKATGPTSTISGEVPGLSDAVVKYGSDPVGPGASKDSNYKNPEYFCYHQASYFEAEIELLQFRCPQPSSKK